MTTQTLYQQLIDFTERENLQDRYPANKVFLSILLKDERKHIFLQEEAMFVMNHHTLIEKDHLYPIYADYLIGNLKSYDWFLKLFDIMNDDNRRKTIKSLDTFQFLPFFIAQLEQIKASQPLEEEIKRLIFDEVDHFFGWYYENPEIQAKQHEVTAIKRKRTPSNADPNASCSSSPLFKIVTIKPLCFRNTLLWPCNNYSVLKLFQAEFTTPDAPGATYQSPGLSCSASEVD